MRILITGGTHGMGKGVAQVLAGLDGGTHEVIILGRSQQLCEDTVAELSQHSGNPAISFVRCDLSRLREVRAAIDQLTDRLESLDALFVNAGLGYAAERVETEDGMDPHFQVNYLAHFMLTLNLLPLLERSEQGGRVVFNVIDRGSLDFDDLQQERDWNYERGLTTAMVAKRMFLLHLHDKLRRRPDCTMSTVGFEIRKTVWSNQIEIIPTGMRLVASLVRLFGGFISIEECGRIMAPLFTEDQATSLARSGKFLTWKKGAYIELPHSDEVLDADRRERLWQLSLELCGDEQTARMAEAWS